VYYTLAERETDKMKKLITLLLALAMLLSLTACGSKTVKMGETVKKGIAEITITDIQVANTNYLEGNTASDDFLYPIKKDDLDIGDQIIKAADEATAPVVISLIVKNVGKSDLSIYPFDFVVNYDDGNEYYSKKCYAKTESSGWTDLEKVTLEKVTSGAVEIRIAVWVPNKVVEDTTSPLELDFHGFTYKIR
jgi:hypothetical protein